MLRPGRVLPSVADDPALQAVLERVRAAGGAPIETDGGWRAEDPGGIVLRFV